MKRTIRLRENEIERVISESVKKALNENFSTDEERAIQCLEFHARNMRNLLSGPLDQIYSTFQIKALDATNEQEREVYSNVVDCVENANDYAKLTLKYLERAEKYLKRLANNQQPQQQQF